jgi:hypothetical protein
MQRTCARRLVWDVQAWWLNQVNLAYNLANRPESIPVSV